MPLRIMTMRIMTLLIFILLTCLPGCSRKAADAHRFRIRTIDGISTAVTTGGPKYTEPLFNFEPELVLFEDMENEDSILFHPAIFIQHENGDFYVADNGNHRIAVFDRSGQYRFAFGQSGQGPGDLGSIQRISFVDGELHAYDAMNTRVSRFHPDGTFIDLTPAPISMRASAGFLYSMHVCSDGRMVLIAAQEEYSNNMISRMSGCIITADEDTLHFHNTGWVQTGIMSPGGGLITMPYTTRPYLAFNPIHGLVSCDGNVPELECLGLDGERRRIVIEEEVRSVTAEIRTSYRSRLQESIRRGSGRRRQIQQNQLDNLVFPDVMPWCTRIDIDDQGYFWLTVYETGDELRAADYGQLYKILSPEGEYLGDVRMPPAIAGKSVSQGRLLIIRAQVESDNNELTVYRMHPAASGFRYP